MSGGAIGVQIVGHGCACCRAVPGSSSRASLTFARVSAAAGAVRLRLRLAHRRQQPVSPVHGRRSDWARSARCRSAVAAARCSDACRSCPGTSPIPAAAVLSCARAVRSCASAAWRNASALEASTSAAAACACAACRWAAATRSLREAAPSLMASGFLSLSSLSRARIASSRVPISRRRSHEGLGSPSTPRSILRLPAGAPGVWASCSARETPEASSGACILHPSHPPRGDRPDQ